MQLERLTRSNKRREDADLKKIHLKIYYFSDKNIRFNRHKRIVPANVFDDFTLETDCLNTRMSWLYVQHKVLEYVRDGRLPDVIKYRQKVRVLAENVTWRNILLCVDYGVKMTGGNAALWDAAIQRCKCAVDDVSSSSDDESDITTEAPGAIEIHLGLVYDPTSYSEEFSKAKQALRSFKAASQKPKRVIAKSALSSRAEAAAKRLKLSSNVRAHRAPLSSSSSTSQHFSPSPSTSSSLFHNSDAENCGRANESDESGGDEHDTTLPVIFHMRFTAQLIYAHKQSSGASSFAPLEKPTDFIEKEDLDVTILAEPGNEISLLDSGQLLWQKLRPHAFKDMMLEQSGASPGAMLLAKEPRSNSKKFVALNSRAALRTYLGKVGEGSAWTAVYKKIKGKKRKLWQLKREIVIGYAATKENAANEPLTESQDASDDSWPMVRNLGRRDHQQSSLLAQNRAVKWKSEFVAAYRDPASLWYRSFNTGHLSFIIQHLKGRPNFDLEALGGINSEEVKELIASLDWHTPYVIKNYTKAKPGFEEPKRALFVNKPDPAEPGNSAPELSTAQALMKVYEQQEATRNNGTNLQQTRLFIVKSILKWLHRFVRFYYSDPAHKVVRTPPLQRSTTVGDLPQAQVEILVGSPAVRKLLKSLKNEVDNVTSEEWIDFEVNCDFSVDEIKKQIETYDGTGMHPCLSIMLMYLESKTNFEAVF